MTDAHRDDVIDRWLKRATTGVAGPGPTAACLDAEVMAAWADGGLSDEALRAVRAHVADCSRCQVLAAVMTRLEPDGAAAASPAAARRWLVWLGPLAAAAAGVLIWVAVPRQSPTLEQAAAPSAAAGQMAQAPPAEGAAPPAASADPKAAGTRDVREEARSPKRETQQTMAADLKRQEVDRNQAARANAGRADADAGRFRQSAATESKKAAVAAPAAAAPPPAPVQQPAAAAERSVLGRLEAVSDAAVKEIASPGVVVRWKLGASRLEKTSDAGRTWAPVPPIAGVNAADLTAGSAPSPTTCWLVGRGGIVLLTTDGSTWRRLDFAEKTDLSAVLATDARNAVVTTVNGREYVSTDGGATWVRRLLQEN